MVRNPKVLFRIFSFTSFISFYITRVVAGSSHSAQKGSKGLTLVSFLCIFIFGFTKVQSTEQILIIYNLKKPDILVAAHEISLVMLHEMLRPCSHVE